MIIDESDDPYCHEDPGPEFKRVPVYKFDIEKNFSSWKIWRTNDGRVLPNSDSNIRLIDNPFDPGSLIFLTVCFDPAIAGRSFGGFGIRLPIDPAIPLNDQTFVEYDLYYPQSAGGAYMRQEIWSTSSGGEGSQAQAGVPGTNRVQHYIRTADLEGLNTINHDSRCGSFNGEAWYKKPVCVITPVSTGNWEYLNIDLHTEIGVKVDDALLMLGNIRITQTEHGFSIPGVVNTKSFSQVDPLKKKYNPDNGYFLFGTTANTAVPEDSLGGRHFDLFVDEDGLKPECHLRPPGWLKDEYPDFTFKPGDEGPEWKLPTDNILSILESGKHGDIFTHGHCLAWVNQSPPWMRQVLPEHITSMQWNSDGLYYFGSGNTAGPFVKVKKETARRIYFDHIVYLMRHFMSTDARYGSSKERGILPFHSFDVVNTEFHESRHSALYQDGQDNWKAALKNTSWLMAMTDDDLNDIKQHYMYLLFKYAHIAVPNKQMAEKYKAGYNNPDIVPDYMKLDSHDHAGSIDAYISEKPPVFVYNEHSLFFYSKTIVVYNMIKELNTAWKTDALYDGRNLIECLGMQGHYSVGNILASRSLSSMTLFARLIDEGLLDCLSCSEMDMRQSDTAPGGGAKSPDILNKKQADSIGYQYALLFKLYEKYKEYIDHVIFWKQYGSSWQNSYVIFDHEQMASQAYYAIMNPDRFIKGHSYLNGFFAGEYEKINTRQTGKYYDKISSNDSKNRQ